MTTTTNRETWLNSLAACMAPRFAELGHPLPPFRVSVGFTSGGKDSKAIGECWDKSTSSDARFEIFLRPDRADSMEVAATLAHELVHAAVGFEHGHKGLFYVVASALGLKRPMTATTAGPDFIAWCEPFLEQLGAIPHGALRWSNTREPSAPRARRGAAGIERDPDADGEDREADRSTGPKKQTTRLHKASCAKCGYNVRVTSKWLDLIGPPHCPRDGAMTVEGAAE